MIVPTIASDGHTYERDAVSLWLEHHPRSPLTNEPLQHLDLYPNHLLRTEIYAFFEEDESLAKRCRFYDSVRLEEGGSRIHRAPPVDGTPCRADRGRLPEGEAALYVEEPRQVNASSAAASYSEGHGQVQSGSGGDRSCAADTGCLVS